MTLEKLLKNAVKEYIKNINLLYSIYFPKSKDLEVIKYLYKLNFIDNNTIEEALEKFVLKRAKKDYEVIVKQNSKIYADHLPFPEYLAYGIKKGIFCENDIKKIPFDHEDTLESFIKEYYKENLIKEMRKKFLSNSE